MDTKVTVFAAQQVSEATLKIEKVWGEVLRVTDRLLLAHHKFGFGKIQENVSPTIEDMLESLRLLEVILDAVANHLDPEDQRVVINAKQAIINVEEVNLALKGNDQDAYELSMRRISNQAPF